MKKKEKRNYHQLRASFATEEEFAKYIKALIFDFLKEENDYKISYYCIKYNITKNCFERIINYATLRKLFRKQTLKKISKNFLKNNNFAYFYV